MPWYFTAHVIMLQACEVLSKPQKSLAYLLETYCGVATNKQLQVWTLVYYHYSTCHVIKMRYFLSLFTFSEGKGSNRGVEDRNQGNTSKINKELFHFCH